jgi:NNP family nitrate/nitrite transporter-like MFS transporter
MTTAASRRRDTGEDIANRRAYIMLGMATVGFVLTFWAWALISPLGAHFKQSLGLNSFEQALVVAVR